MYIGKHNKCLSELYGVLKKDNKLDIKGLIEVWQIVIVLDVMLHGPDRLCMTQK